MRLLKLLPQCQITGKIERERERGREREREKGWINAVIL